MILMGENPAQQRGDNLPVTHINYGEIYQFITKMNKLDPAHSYDLPTEAEWEYACRAGTTGDYAGDVKEMAWYKNNSDGTIHAVGSKKPNAWGIYDMHGNVAEWCKDYFDPKYYGKDRSTRDPECMLPMSGYAGDRVVRGGGYGSEEKNCRSSYRVNNGATNVSDYVGFRLIRRPKVELQ
jgi:formylglycine-generating enzyme required for sulfatase activity